MIDVPDRLFRLIFERGRKIVAEMPATLPGRRAWVTLSVNNTKTYITDAHLDPMPTRGYVAKFELRAEFHGPEYEEEIGETIRLEAMETFDSEDIEEAVAKAFGYQPDFDKWGTYVDNPECP